MATDVTAQTRGPAAQALARVPRDLLIGSWRPATDDRRFTVSDPATGDALASVADGSAEDALSALDAAVAAEAEWTATTPEERGSILRAAFDTMTARAEDLALLITLEMGKPLAESRAEVSYGAGYVRWYAEEALRASGRTTPSPDGRSTILTHREPIGPCLLITPWNFPLAMGMRKVAPALAAGCTAI